MKVQLLLVEDDLIWRTMLARFINNEQDLQVVQAVETKEAAVSYCSNNKIDVVLMDINLTDNNLDGIQATLELSLMEQDVKVIALTSLDDEEIILDTYTAGAIHYVSKSDFREIPDVIRGVLRESSPHKVLMNEYLRLKEAEQYNMLTDAERQIVSLSEAGLGREQMKQTLVKSEGTLKNQITNILRKLKVKSLKEAIQVIKSRGLSNKEINR